MDKKYFLAFVSLVVIIALVFFYSKKSGIVGNTEIINEITRIEELSFQSEQGASNLTVNDLQKLKNFVKGDETAESYMKEIEWLIAKGQIEHIAHSTSFLKEYVRTGDSTPCLPHELEHIALFIRYGDFRYAKDGIKDIDSIYIKWEKSVDKKSKESPLFYRGLDSLKIMSKDAIKKIKAEDFSNETLDQIELIGNAGIC